MYREPGQRDDSETYYRYERRSVGARMWFALAIALASTGLLGWGALVRDLTLLLAGALGVLASIAAITILGMRVKRGDFAKARIEPGPVRVEIPAGESSEEVEASDKKDAL